MKKKVCLITGATSGIGKASAYDLAQQQYHVILVARDHQKGISFQNDLIQQTKNSSIDLFLADLSSQSQIHALAKEIHKKYAQLDILINNAGAIFQRRTLSVDNIEMTFALNHLGYFLTTALLFDLLAKASDARIINVASSAHKRGIIDFDDIQFEKNYGELKSYAQSKLANIMFTYELARRVKNHNITVNCLHPGVVATNFGQNNQGGITKWFFKTTNRLMITAEQGAQTIIYLATSQEAENVTGKYFVKKRPVSSSSLSNNHEAAKRLWEISEYITKTKFLS